MAEAIDDSVGDALEDGCGPDNIDPDVAHAIIRYYGIGVLNGVLRDSPGSGALLLETPPGAQAGDVDLQVKEAR